MDYEKIVLPAFVVAQHYDLFLTPNLGGENDFKYEGHVDICLNIKQAGLNSLTLHSKELDIKECSVVGADKKETEKISSTNVTFDTKELSCKIDFASQIPEGDVVVSIDFTGIHNDQMCGFYRSKYTDVDGNEQTMLSTQFEPNDARRCFPCIDEPAAKATFSATLVIPKDRIALSNMPIVAETAEPGGKKKVVFEKTPKMSTYLLAFCVGEFDYIESSTKTKAGTKLRVYTTPGKSEQGRFALEVGVKALDIYDGMFGQPFPLPKMDMIAIPEFAAGAMENWGLVTYREVDLLIDENASGRHIQRVAIVVAHELAHQWFGNLVTMTWWDDLWLNEGFASWMENYCTDLLFPEWKLWDQFVTDAQAAALSMDSMLSSHPVQVPIPSAHDVDEVFDAISYCKGACVIQAVHAHIGHESFIKGLQLYMEKHKYGNAETKDLCDAWSTASGENVFELVECWTRQMGFPIVTISDQKQNKGISVLTAKQNWFLADGSLPDEGKDRKWIIPMFAQTPKSVETLKTFSAPTASIEVSAEEGEFIKLNAGQKIPIRVNYSPPMWRLLTEAIRDSPDLIPSVDRAGLVQDCYSITKAGLLDPAILLELVAAFKKEDNYVVWDGVTTVLFGLHEAVTGNADLTQKLENLAASLVLDPFKELGWDNKPDDGHLTKLLRSLLFASSAKFVQGDESFLKEAQERFDLYVTDPNGSKGAEALPTDYRGAVFRLLLKQKNAKAVENYEILRKLVDEISNAADKTTAMGSLGYVSDMKKKEEVLDWATTEVKIQDFFYVIGGVSGSNREGLDLSWNYFKDNYDRITKRIESANVAILEATIIYSARGFNTEEKALEIQDFFEGKPDNRAKRTVVQLVEATRNRAKITAVILGSERFAKALEKY